MPEGAVPLRRSLAWYAIAQAVPGVAMLFAVPLWLRLVGAPEYAHYATVWAVSVTATAASTGWLRQAMLRATGQDDSDLHHLPVWSVAGSLALPGLACGLVSLLTTHSIGAAVVACLFGLSSAAALLAATVLQRAEQAKYVAMAESGRALGGIVLSLVLFLALPRSSTVILLACVLANVVVLAVLVVGARANRGRGGTTSSSVLAAWWAYGWPMSLWLGLAPLLLYSDRLLLRPWVDSEMLGAYSASSDLIVRGAAVIATPVTMSLTPIVMRLANAGEASHEVLALTRVWMWRLAVLFAVLLVLVLLIGRQVIELLLGVDVVSTSTLAGLLVGGALWQIGLLAHKPLEIERRTRAMLATLVVATSLGVVAVAVLAAVQGPAGAAWAMAGAAGVYVCGTWMLGNRVTLTSRRAVPDAAR